jgi:hypothetical protein
MELSGNITLTVIHSSYYLEYQELCMTVKVTMLKNSMLCCLIKAEKETLHKGWSVVLITAPGSCEKLDPRGHIKAVVCN